MLQTLLNKANFDKFVKAYLVAALWSETDDAGDPLDSDFGVDDLVVESRQSAEKDCDKFIIENATDLQLAFDGYTLTGEWSVYDQAGHDFWLSRNGHGVGFFDRGLGEVGERLQDACRSWGVCDAYVGDDGKLHLDGVGKQSERNAKL